MSVITWMLSISIQDWEHSWRMGHFLLKNAKSQYVGRFVPAWGEISRKYFSLDKENENVSKLLKLENSNRRLFSKLSIRGNMKYCFKTKNFRNLKLCWK